MLKQPFIPLLLPPKINYSSLLMKIVSARDIVSRYDEAVKRLPNPEIIQRSIRTKEAVLSSRIEGTQVTLDEMLLLDAQEEMDEDTQKEMDYREVFNYREAIFEGKRILQERPLTENVIKRLHKILLNSVRGKDKAPGEFRIGQAYFGKPGASIEQAIFIFAPPQEITRLFSNLEKFLHLEENIDPIVQIAIAHYQFEAIHPFSDGNGRVGRLIMQAMLLIRNLPPAIIKQEKKQFYHNSLKKSQLNKDFLPLENFICDAILKGFNVLERKSF